MINLYESVNKKFNSLNEAFNDVVVVDAQNIEDAEGQINKEHTTLIIKGQPVDKLNLSIKRFVTKLILPDAVTLPCAFMDWGYYRAGSQLVTVIAPNLKIIYPEAFINCDKLKKVVMPNLERIDSNAFRGCYNLTEIDLTPVKEIGLSAFMGCEHLRKVTFNKNVKIGNYAFSYCKSLREVYVPDEATCSANAFQDCNLDVLKFPRSTDYIEPDDINDYHWSSDVAARYGTLLVSKEAYVDPRIQSLFRQVVTYD